MEFITEMVGAINGVVWGVPMMILILGASLFLTVGLRFLRIMEIAFGFSPRFGEAEFPAMMLVTSLPSTR